MSVSHPPISLEGFAGCLLYLALSIAGKTPDPALLLIGLRHGGILDAESQQHPEDGRQVIAVRFRDQQEPMRMRSWRLLDPLGFLLLRFAMTPATLLRIDRTEKNSPDNPRKEGHRITVHDDIIWYRVVGDARPGETIEQLDHLDLSRGSLVKVKESGAAHQGFETLLERTLAAYDRYPPDHLPLSREGLAMLLKKTFALVQKIPLGSPAP